MERWLMWHQAKYPLTIPLTARLISISSKSLWSSMAATSQRYSAVSDRVVLKIRMLAGSLSWALCSKSPFDKKRKKNTLQLLIQIHNMTSQFKKRIQCQVLSRYHSFSWALSLETLLWKAAVYWLMSFPIRPRVSKRFTCYLVLKVHITGDAIFNLFPFDPRVVCWDGLY